MDRKVKGYTAVEIVITIAILSILASFAFLWLRNLVLNQRLKATTDELISVLNTARMYSMTGRNVRSDVQGSRPWGVAFISNKTYILFEDANFNCMLDDGEDARQFQAEAGVIINENCGGIIVFDKKGYPRSKTCGLGMCSITLTNQVGSRRTINISRYGRINYETQ